MDPLALFLSLMFGSFGFGFFIYGKKQGKAIPLFVGLTLMIYPYFVSNTWVMSGIGVVLIFLPILLR